MSVTDVAFPTAAHAGVADIVLDSDALSRERRGRSRRSSDRNDHLLAEIGRWFLNGHPQPHLVIDRLQRVLAMNRPAQLLLKSCRSIELRGSSLFFASLKHSAEVNQVLEGEIDRISFPVMAPSGRVIVSMTCIHRSPAMFLISTSTISHDELDVLRSEFGLTAAESEVAFSVYSGLSLVRISKQRGASINTVKTQARYVFQKCGVRSQVELTRRVGEVLLRS
jgi:DNA-binding CsgD family transcriptional regulator